MKVAAAYIRVSTEDQVEFSPDSQLEKIKLYAEKNEMLLPDEYIFLDEGISGRNTAKRPAFNAMIALAKHKPKPFDIILVWKYSRFARNREDSVVYKSMLRKELNIDVVSISEDVGDDKMSVLFEAMIEAMDEYYSINLAEEVKRGMTEKAKRGGVLSIPAFGYKLENGKFHIIPEEAEVIKKVFNDYLNGKGFLSIAKSLNAMGIRTHRGNQIENRTVEYWLNNPVYVGKIRWNPDGALSRNYSQDTAIISDGAHTPIIDTATWEKAQIRLKEQKARFSKYYNPDRRDISHWLTGLVRCEKCGAVLSNQGGFFGCSNQSRSRCKGVGYIAAKKLEIIVLNTLSALMLPNVTFSWGETEPKPTTDESSETKMLQAQLQRLEIRLKRIKLAYEDGIDTLEEYKTNKKELQDELKGLKQALATARQETDKARPEKNQKAIRRLIEILDDKAISNTEKNKVARSIFKAIIKGGQDNKTLQCIFWR